MPSVVRTAKNGRKPDATIDVDMLETIWRRIWGIPANITAPPEVMLEMVWNSVNKDEGGAPVGWMTAGGVRWGNTPDTVKRVPPSAPFLSVLNIPEGNMLYATTQVWDSVVDAWMRVEDKPGEEAEDPKANDLD